ncbi:hypothetical protein [Streptomyces violaceusniger]|uniref:hypothetical protein n=1 Tax=Streptomyces violaceusniger TaxID=68280 RepID=UPI00142F2F71|nr:hypothetical protein [Streptomyces violaceusniger]
MAKNLGLSLRALTSRLAAYRVKTGMTLPQRATELDRELFRYDDLLRLDAEDFDERDGPWWFLLGPDDEIPFFVLVMAARDLGRRPRELAAAGGFVGYLGRRSQTRRVVTRTDTMRATGSARAGDSAGHRPGGSSGPM